MIVCIGAVGSRVRLGWVPAARVTAIVSPTARESPRTIPAVTPDSAAGKTMRVATWRLVAPTA